MAVVPNSVETLPKILIAWVGCTNVTDRRQTDRRTDGRWHSEREREFTTSRSLISSILQIYVRGARSRLSLRARRDHDPALLAGALPQTPLVEIKALSRPLAGYKGFTSKGRYGRNDGRDGQKCAVFVFRAVIRAAPAAFLSYPPVLCCTFILLFYGVK